MKLIYFEKKNSKMHIAYLYNMKNSWNRFTFYFYRDGSIICFQLIQIELFSTISFEINEINYIFGGSWILKLDNFREINLTEKS